MHTGTAHTKYREMRCEMCHDVMCCTAVQAVLTKYSAWNQGIDVLAPIMTCPPMRRNRVAGTLLGDEVGTKHLLLLSKL